MTTLVTGGTGFVGGALVRALHARGERVRVLARPTSDTAALEALGIEIATGDILERSSLERALAGCDTLYHAAAIYEFWNPDKAHLMRTQVDGTRTVMGAAQETGVDRVIYTSTAFTIGEPKGEIGNEATPHRGYFRLAYEEAKYHAEQVVMEYAREGLPVVTVNPSGVYGPGPIKPVGATILDAAHGRIPMVFAGRVSLVYLDDTVQGHLLAAERGRIGERYILSGVVIPTAEFIGTVCTLVGVRAPRPGPIVVGRLMATLAEVGARLSGRPPFLARDTVAMFDQGLQVDGSKAERDLGLVYTPFDEAMRRTLSWYWEQGMLDRKPAFLADAGVSPHPV